MGAAKYQQFIDAVKEASKAGLFSMISKWESAARVLNRLAMFNILRALSAVTELERGAVREGADGVGGMEAKRSGSASRRK